MYCAQYDLVSMYINYSSIATLTATTVSVGRLVNFKV